MPENSRQIIAAGAAAGVVAALVSNPLDVMKTTLQTNITLKFQQGIKEVLYHPRGWFRGKNLSSIPVQWMNEWMNEWMRRKHIGSLPSALPQQPGTKTKTLTGGMASIPALGYPVIWDSPDCPRLINCASYFDVFFVFVTFFKA